MSWWLGRFGVRLWVDEVMINIWQVTHQKTSFTSSAEQGGDHTEAGNSGERQLPVESSSVQAWRPRRVWLCHSKAVVAPCQEGR